jgi:CheY-like chemotaxis protein
MTDQRLDAGASILLVEDDTDSREILAEILEEEGYRVACAANGQEALDYLQSNTSPPRLILLDLMMPVMDGWQFLDEQRRTPNLATIPVVIVTGMGARTRKNGLGVAGYLLKPIDVTALLGMVASYCQGGC